MSNDLIDVGADRIRRTLLRVARQAVAEAGKGTATVAGIVLALELVVDRLPGDLAEALAAELPEIAAEAIAEAEAEIAPAREASGLPFPEVQPPAAGNYGAWLATAAGAIVAAAREAAEAAGDVEPARRAAVQVVDDVAEIDRIADTAAGRTVNDSRLATFRANRDVVEGLVFDAVNDSKTSEVCSGLDAKIFEMEAKDLPTPPLHIKCRSRLRAVLKQVKRKDGATDKEVDRQNWAVYRRIQREVAAEAEGRAAPEVLETRLAPAVDADAGTFAGYAVAWEVLDNHRTAFRRGAFDLSATRPALLWSHDPERPVGAIVEIREDDRGLFVRGRLTLDTTDGREAHALLRDKAVTGLSIGFRRRRDEPMPGGRRILEADLKEVSLVALPSNESARILEVRAGPVAMGAADEQRSMKMPDDMTKTAPENGADKEKDVTARVDALETTVATIKSDVAEIKSAVSKTEERADRIEARSARLGLGGGATGNDGNTLERRAFSGFLRHGREALPADEVRSLRVSDDTAGGYLAPDQFVAELLRNVVQFSPVRQVARVANTGAGAVTLPRRTGGMTAAWVGETSARPATSVTFGSNRYEVAELAAYIDVSNAMLEDSAFDVEKELAFEFAEEFGRAEGAAFVGGDGHLKPLGFMQHADLGFTKSGSASAITADGIIQIYHDLPRPYRGNGVWMMNASTLAAVRKLKTTGGDYLLAMAGINGAPATTLLGRPVIEAEDLPDVSGGEFPLVFGDFAQGFRIFDRVQLSVLRDPYSVATSGQTRFHARRRVAAGVAKAEAIRKLKIAS